MIGPGAARFLPVCLCLLCPLAAEAQIKLGARLVAGGFSEPTAIARPRDGSGRFFIGELGGRIRVIDSNGLTLPEDFLHLGQGGLNRILHGSEYGLLHVEFHPDYILNGRFFVYYNRLEDGATVLAEYRVSSNPNQADPTETPILTIPQPFLNHNGGQIAFGPDGYLYLSLGDGGFQTVQDFYNNAQNKNSLLGKILRIDVDSARPYAIPATNPFVGTDGADEIFAMGFRNPWRISFDRATGRLFAADVGHLEQEEIDLVVKGGNYGWRVMEGNGCFPNTVGGCNPEGAYTTPIHAYPHTIGSCVTGGHVYRGRLNPQLEGLYLFADFYAGWIWGLLEEPGHAWRRLNLWQSPWSIATFGEDENGEIYFADYFKGEVLQLVDLTTCDLNSDFSVDGTDLQHFLRQAKGAEPPEGVGRADLNLDGGIDYRDIFLMQRFWDRRP
ncbi:MAG: hypothetical protein GHCLOJNM_04194 [bacterium]|nr:hypothetical protein [bacterium]